jgi:hypothetical protein
METYHEETLQHIEKEFDNAMRLQLSNHVAEIKSLKETHSHALQAKDAEMQELKVRTVDSE